MLDKKFVKKNLPRLIAMAFVAGSLSFEIRSILNKETPDHHPNYNIASMIGPMIGMSNMMGRILDHRGDPNKQKNIMGGVGAIVMMMLEMCFSASTFLSPFKQPIALPSLIGALSLIFVSCVNWEPLAADGENKNCKMLAKKNAGRIAALNGISIAMGTSIASIALNNERLFYASNLGLNLASLGESSNRVYDITVTHKEDTNLINKSCAISFFFIALANAASNTSAMAGVWNAPIAFSVMVMHVGLLLYMIAQCDFKRDLQNNALSESLIFDTQTNEQSAALRV